MEKNNNSKNNSINFEKNNISSSIKDKINKSSQKAFTIVEILIVVAIIGTVASMAIPQFAKARSLTKKSICINNLRQIDAAIDRWVFEHDFPEGGTLTSSQEEEAYSYMRNGQPSCPSGGVYTIGTIGIHPQITCSIEGHTLVGQ